MWRSADEARTFVRSLGLKNVRDWEAYCSSGKKPADIPANLPRVYAKDGWTNWPDWLGIGYPRSGWRSFDEARAFVRSLGLKSHEEWKVYCASKNKPTDIPSNPQEVYAGKGWISWGDFLGR